MRVGDQIELSQHQFNTTKILWRDFMINIVPLNPMPASDACQMCHAKDICLSSRLESHDLHRFKDSVVHKKPMQRGDLLFMAGDNIQSIFVLHSGSVKAYLESVDGDNQITGFYLPGDIIGIHGIESKRHTDTVEALETSSVCEIRFDNIGDIFHTFPALQQELLGFIFKEMNHDQEMMLVLGKMSADRRMAYFLLDVAKRLQQHGQSSSRINLTMTRHDISNYLGLAVETVSRILTRLQKSDVISVDRRSVTILDRTQLEKIYSGSSDELGRQQHNQ
jgi:CRP/FNR family transcriptional regulator